MAHTVLYDDGVHRNILLEDASSDDTAVQANQHLIIHGKSAMLLDPGGHKVYSKVLAHTFELLRGAKLEILFLSHQDPDIVAAVNGWLMSTEAVAYCSQLWVRFVPHFGLSHLVQSRLLPIEDRGTVLHLGDAKLPILPAHFLHSAGNFQVYDPLSKILYTGDLGSSLGEDLREVSDFDAHVPSMLGFHRRYMASNRAMKQWVQMARKLDVEVIAPQHGALFRGAQNVNKFYDWCENLPCGMDLLDDVFQVPPY